MPYSWRIAQFLAKVEAVEGTAVALAAADAKIQCMVDPDVDIEIPFAPRNVIAATAGAFAGAAGGPRIGRFRIRVPLHGSAAAGTAPAWGILLTSGGFTETIVPSTSVTYAYAAGAWAAFKTITAAFNLDGLETKLHGARVKSIRIFAPNGKPWEMEAEIMGVYNEPSAVAAVAAVYQAGKWEAWGGGTFTLGGTVLKIAEMQVAIENECEPRPAPSLAPMAFSIHGGPGSVTGSLDPEIEIPATRNFFNLMTANTEEALSAIWGATAGSILTLSGPKVQTSALKHDRRGHTGIYRTDLQFNRSTGDDCLSIVCT